MFRIFLKSVAATVLSLLFFVALGGASQSGTWEIVGVTVVGAQAVSDHDIETFVREKLSGNYFFVYARDNSFIFPRWGIERELSETFPRIKSVTVRRTDLHNIVVTVAERRPVVLWCGENVEDEMRTRGGCWFVDDTGFIFDRAPIFSEGVYRELYSTLVYADGEMPLRAIVPSERFLFARTVGERIEHEIGGISRFFIEPEGAYRIIIRSSDLYPVLAGAEVRFRDGQQTDRLIKNLLVVLPVQFPADYAPQKELLYIDLSFGNKVFFGFEE